MSEQKNKILVIDDEPDLREMVGYQFQARGFEVFTAEDGLMGLERLKEITPDLIILDMNMPRMGGLEFYQKICGADNKPKYPVLVLTARANLEQLFKELAVNGFMTKPFEIDLLIKEGETIIKKNKRIGPLSVERDLTKPRSIFVAEDDSEAFKKISIALLEAEYKVDSAKSGTLAIEKMMMTPPDVALVKLGLKDISGDIVAMRLKNLSKTSDVKVILYTPKSDQTNFAIVRKIGEKEGIAATVEYITPDELIEAVDQVLQMKK